MANTNTDLFLINGQPMLAPDADISFSYEDLDSSDSGRDESGVMHRIVVRYKVGSWSFEFSHLTEADMQYMESLFGETPDFLFTHPSRTNSGEQVTTKCYRSKYGIAWHNAKTGMWRNYKFNIIEC